MQGHVSTFGCQATYMTEAVAASVTLNMSCSDAGPFAKLLNQGHINPFVAHASADDDFVVGSVEAECLSDSSVKVVGILAVPANEVGDFIIHWVDSDVTVGLKQAYSSCINAARVASGQAAAIASVNVYAAENRCANDGPCQNGSSCDTVSANGVVANKVACTCPGNGHYSGDQCQDCQDHAFIASNASGPTEALLGSTKISFISSCGPEHEVRWTATKTLEREIRRQCDIVGVQNNQMQEELENLRNSMLREGGCTAYRSEFASFNSNWTQKLAEHNDKLVASQNVLQGVLAAIQSGPFNAADKAKAAAYDSGVVMGLSESVCDAMYVNSHSHNYLDTLAYAEKQELTYQGDLLDRTDSIWLVARTIYLDCHFDRDTNSEDVVSAWEDFSADFGITESRRLSGPVQGEARRLSHHAKADVGLDGASSVWKAVNAIFE
jgi:hypothetical protein